MGICKVGVLLASKACTVAASSGQGGVQPQRQAGSLCVMSAQGHCVACAAALLFLVKAHGAEFSRCALFTPSFVYTPFLCAPPPCPAPHAAQMWRREVVCPSYQRSMGAAVLRAVAAHALSIKRSDPRSAAVLASVHAMMTVRAAAGHACLPTEQQRSLPHPTWVRPCCPELPVQLVVSCSNAAQACFCLF